MDQGNCCRSSQYMWTKETCEPVSKETYVRVGELTRVRELIKFRQLMSQGAYESGNVRVRELMSQGTYESGSL